MGCSDMSIDDKLAYNVFTVTLPASMHQKRDKTNKIIQRTLCFKDKLRKI